MIDEARPRAAGVGGGSVTRRPLGARLRVAVLAVLARLLLRVLRWTTRADIRADGAELLRCFAGEERVVVAFWHGQLAMVPFAYRGPGICIQVSRHTDGEIIARAIRPFGVRAARGSASRGGIASLREMLAAFREGLDLAVAPDGPRGPFHRAKVGAIQLARATGARLFPVACAPRRGWTFERSWDRFVVPRPFTRIYYAAGEPLVVPRDATDEDLEAARARLESELNRLTDEAAKRAASA